MITTNNGICWFRPEFDIQNSELLFSDASDLACGMLYNNSWSVLTFTDNWAWLKHSSIQVRELMALLLCLSTWGSQLAGKNVIMNIDNLSIVHVLNSGRSKNSRIMSLVRATYFYTTMYNINYRAVHLYI